MNKLKNTFSRMYPYVRGCLFKWGMGNFCDIVGLSIFSVLTACALENFLDAAAGLQMSLFYDGLKKLGLAVLVMFVFEGLYKRLFADALSSIKISMQEDLFGKFLTLPCILNEEDEVGERLIRLNQDVEISQNFVGRYLTEFLSSIVMAIVSVVCIGTKNLLLGMAALVMFLIIIVINFKYQTRQERITAEIISKNGEINTVFEETLNGGITLRTNRLQPFAKLIFTRKSDELMDLKNSERKITLFQKLYGYGALKLMILFLLGSGAFLCSVGKLGVGSLFFIFQFGMNLGGYAEQFCNSFIVLSKAQGGVERFFSILERSDEADLYGSAEISGKDISIKLRDVQVKYPNRTVLDHMEMDFKTGEYIALVGESGAGKTTLLNVILQFVNHEGKYTINGKNVKEYSLKEFRKIFSYIPQNPEIFNSTVRENILCGNPNAGEEEMIEAARLAGAYEFIERLPEKYDTLITDNGGNLSGGERQRIAIARAFIKNAPVLVLDEFTSELDPETESSIKLALERIKEGKLVIMVAHRGSMINAAERTVTI